MTKEPHDSGPPKWKDADAQAAFLARPLPDPKTSVCGICLTPKYLVRNKITDQFSDTFYCPSCDGDLG